MASINISLSDELKRYVEDQVKGGSYGNVSEFIRSLLRDQQKREAQERLELLLLEGIASGSDGPMTKTDWQELRKAAADRVARKKRGASGKGKGGALRKPKGKK